MEPGDGEILKIRVNDIQLKDLLSDEIKERYNEEMNVDLKVPSMIFALENGAVFANHPNRETEDEEIIEIETNDEEALEKFCDFIEIVKD